MRVQEMFYLVKHALDTWVDPIFVEHKNVRGDVTAYSCRNAHKLVALLEPLRPFPEINKQIELIYSTHNTFYKGEPGALTNADRNKISQAAQEIKSSLLVMQSMCAALDVEVESDGFDVKLPPDITLAELAELTKDLNIVFTQCPLLQSDGGQIKLRGVDVGSSWLTFTVIGSAVANLITSTIAAIVGRVHALRAQSLKLKEYEEVVKQVEMKTEILQQVVESNKKIIKGLTAQAAAELAQDKNVTNPEDIERIRMTLDVLMEWSQKGMEIYAAIDSPEEIKTAFPSLEMQALPKFFTKELESHTEEEEE